MSAASEAAHPLDAESAGGRLIRGSGLRVASYVLSLLVGLASAPLLVRHLTVAEFGVFVTVNSILFVIAGLTEGGLGSVAVREYTVADADGRRSLLRNLLGLRLTLAVAGVAIALGFTLIAGYAPLVTLGVAIAGAGLVIGALQSAWATALEAELKLGWLSLLDIVRQLVTTVGIVVLVVAGASLTPFFAVGTVALAVMLAATLRPVGALRRLRPGFELAAWKELARQSVVFAVATAVGVAYFQVAIIATSLLAGATDAGLYGAAFRILELANGVPFLLAAAAFPIVARAAATDAARLRHALQRMFDSLLLLGGLFAVAFVVGAPFALQVIGGDKLDPAVDVLRLLGIALPFRFLVAGWAYALFALKADRRQLTVNAVAFGASIVLAVVLIPRFGATGAAVVTVSLEVLLAGLLAVGLSTLRPDLRPDPAGVPRFVAWLTVALAVGLLVPLPVVPATLLATAVYLTGMHATGGIPAEVVDAVREKLPRRRS